MHGANSQDGVPRQTSPEELSKPERCRAWVRLVTLLANRTYLPAGSRLALFLPSVRTGQWTQYSVSFYLHISPQLPPKREHVGRQCACVLPIKKKVKKVKKVGQRLDKFSFLPNLAFLLSNGLQVGKDQTPFVPNPVLRL